MMILNENLPPLETDRLSKRTDETWNEWFHRNPGMYHACVFDYGIISGNDDDTALVAVIRNDVINRLNRLEEAVARAKSPHGICLSGAARGADALWGEAAVSAGSQALHWSFPGHAARAKNTEGIGLIASLSPLTTEIASGPMSAVARVMGRRLTNKPEIRSLLLRNWFQIAWSDSVYAVSDFKNGNVEGGTAWAVEAFRLKKSGNAWVFIQAENRWYVSSAGEEFVPDPLPPVPSDIWAGIGRRDLKESGIKAIHEMGRRMKEEYADTQENSAGLTHG